MGWFLYDNGLRHERVNKVPLSANQLDINVSITEAATRDVLHKNVFLKTRKIDSKDLCLDLF